MKTRYVHPSSMRANLKAARESAVARVLPAILFVGLFCAAAYGQTMGEMVEPLYYEEPTELIKEPGPMAPDIPQAVTAMPFNFHSGTPNTFTAGRYPSLPKRGWPVHFGLTAGVMWDDNVFMSKDGADDDFIVTVAPIVVAELGRGRADDGPDYAVRLSYSPAFQFFMSHPEEDTIDHDVDIDINAGLPFNVDLPKTKVRTRVGLHTGGGGDIEIGERVERTSVTAGITFEHYLSGKMTLSGGIGTEIEIFQEGDFYDSDDLRGDVFLNYEVLPKVSVGLGMGVGTTSQDGGAQQVYYQPMAQVRYQVTGKASLGLMGGLELRDIEGYGTEMSPIFGADMSWNVRQGTNIGLMAYERIRPSSVMEDENVDAIGVALSVRQQFFQRYYATFTSGYERSDYTPTADGVVAVRSDDFWYLRLNLDAAITDWWSIGLFYEYRMNDSNLPNAYSFDNNRAGIYTSLIW